MTVVANYSRLRLVPNSEMCIYVDWGEMSKCSASLINMFIP